jgi:lipoyl(octanoyl) transferase
MEITDRSVIRKDSRRRLDYVIYKVLQSLISLSYVAFMTLCAVQKTPPGTPVLWRSDAVPVSYLDAVAFMEERAAQIRSSVVEDMVWLLEHPALYTAGTSAKKSDLLNPQFPVFETGRGGQYTYHGPGQRIAYVMTDLQKRGQDLRRYICDLESWVIAALEKLGVRGERHEGRVGIWVVTPVGEKKIAAIGVRVRKWVAYHGVSINVDPDLSHYGGIIPCGIAEHGVTSLKALGSTATMADVDQALQASWKEIF